MGALGPQGRGRVEPFPQEVETGLNSAVTF